MNDWLGLTYMDVAVIGATFVCLTVIAIRASQFGAEL